MLSDFSGGQHEKDRISSELGGSLKEKNWDLPSGREKPLKFLGTEHRGCPKDGLSDKG